MNEKAMLGGKVRRLRRQHGLTQMDMAKKLGISASYLNLIEHNQRPVTVPLLIKLTQLFDLDVQAFAGDEEAQLAAALTQVFADAVFEGHQLGQQELKELAHTAPSACQAILALYRAYRAANDDAQALAERMTGDDPVSSHENRTPAEEVSDFIQASLNHFPELEEAAEALWTNARLDNENLHPGLAAHLDRRHGVRVDILPAAEAGASLRRYDPAAKRIRLSEMLPRHSRAFNLAHQLALIEYGDLIERLLESAPLTTDESHALGRIALANYFAGAVLLPYEPFRQTARALRHDIELMCQRYDASFEQACHRLTTLNRPGAKGVPFHMLRVDIAGNISKRFSSSGIPISRYGGACPRWNVHEAFLTPGMIRTQISRMPDGATFFCIARSLHKGSGGYPSPPAYLAIGLGCHIAHARELVYADGVDLDNEAAAVPIGVNCRLCERLDCRQRAFPPLHHRLNVDENTRGLSAYVTARD